MQSNKKNNNAPFEFILPFIIALIALHETSNINITIEVFIKSTAIVCMASFLIRSIFAGNRRKKLLESGIDEVNLMSGEEFEKFLLVHFEQLGYKGHLTDVTNDYGADLVLKNGSEKIVVQAKRWKNKVGVDAVQQVIGAKGYYKADRCIVVTNSYFTNNAVNLADKNDVELWDRNKLIDIMNKNNGRETAVNILNNSDTKVCPKCGSKLKLRKGKYGYFYGCANYPYCNFTNKDYDNLKNMK